MADGGNVSVIEIDGLVVRLMLEGACGSCPSSTTTMRMGIQVRKEHNYIFFSPVSTSFRLVLFLKRAFVFHLTSTETLNGEDSRDYGRRGGHSGESRA